MCGEATKGAPTEGASAPYKGRSTGRRKKVEENRGKESSTHGQATRSAVRVEKKFSGRGKKESREALWQRGARGSMPTGTRIVHREGNSDIHKVQKMWRERMPCERQQRTRDNPRQEKMMWMSKGERGEGNMSQRERSTAKQRMTRRVGTCSQRGGQSKGDQENLHDTHQVKVNVYYKGHVKRMRMDVCDLGKIEIILGMPQLAAHNSEINWETREVKMTRCLPLYGGAKLKEEKRKKKRERVVTLEKEKIVRWAIDNKENQGREEEIEEDHRKIKEIVPKRFLKWEKVFGKVESERMPTRKSGIMLQISRRCSNHKKEEFNLCLK